MPSTHLSLHYHVVFSTKDRHPLIAPEWQERLHAYIGGTVRDLGGIAECVGGIDDHVHLLIGLKATHRLCDVLREIKVSSSKWIHETMLLREFAWETGDYVSRCPWLDQVPRQKKYSCRIQAMKPEICRVFPVSREHAEEKGCLGFGYAKLKI